MHPDFQQLMDHATRLTQSGDLTAATAAIQAALRGVSPASATASTATAWQDDPNVIDVEARVVPDREGEGGTTRVDTDERSESAPASSDTSEKFIEGSFRNAAGRRDYKLYIPPNAGNTPLPLVIMLHGCTQNADDFAAGTDMNSAARERGFYVLYPD